MCGIFGHLGQVERQLATYCVNTMVHRGPDGMGLWVDDKTPVTLGHRRLSILDLSTDGAQPMLSASGRYAIVFNGEVYNFVELRKELEAKGYTFRSDSDTEVVVNGFEVWGEDLLLKMNGMWSLAIWDRQERRLFMARDRWGKKPLFYAFLSGGRFAFASEMKALFPLLPQVRPNTNVVGKMDRIYTIESSEDCVIEGIKRFPSATSAWLKYGEDRLKMKQWWCTLDHLPTDVPRKYEDQVEMFRSLFLESCRIRMRSDVPIGTALSGGLDSSATMSGMAHLKAAGLADRSKFPLTAFVCSFPNTPFDESYYAKQVIEKWKLNSKIIEIDPRDGLSKFEEHYYLFEEIYITSLIPFMITYGEVKKAGVSVTLDGHAGDELFAGYTIDHLGALRDAGWNPFAAKSVLDTYYDSFPKDSPQFAKFPPKWKFFLKSRRDYMRQKEAGQLEVVQSRDMNHPRWKELGFLNQRLYAQTHDTTLPTLLRNYDRLSMANSVEIRMPFLDWRLVTFAFALPWTSKIRNGYAKAIVRDGMAPDMPHEVAYRKSKIGWSSPIVDWMKGPLKPFIQDMINSQSFRECPHVDAAYVSKRMNQLIEDPNAQYFEAQDLWTMLTPYIWERSVITNWKNFADRAQSSRAPSPQPGAV